MLTNKSQLFLEPGYYENGQFGIRLENIIRIVNADLKHNFANRGYLRFEDVTFCPIQRKMIKLELLTLEEVGTCFCRIPHITRFF